MSALTTPVSLATLVKKVIPAIKELKDMTYSAVLIYERGAIKSILLIKEVIEYLAFI